MRYPNLSREIAKIVIACAVYLLLLSAYILTVIAMFQAGWFYWRELVFAVLFVLAANILLFKTSGHFITSVLLLVEGVDIFMKARLDSYFEDREYFILKHGEYRAGIYFQKRPDGPLNEWELAYEKQIHEVNSNNDKSKTKEMESTVN